MIFDFLNEINFFITINSARYVLNPALFGHIRLLMILYIVK